MGKNSLKAFYLLELLGRGEFFGANLNEKSN